MESGSPPEGQAQNAGAGESNATPLPGSHGGSSAANAGAANAGGMATSGTSGSAASASPATSVGGTSNAGSGGASGAAAGGALNSGGSSGGAAPEPRQRTVGYLPARRGPLKTWATQLDFSLVSYVDVCFANIDGEGNVSYADAALPAFASAAHAKGSKVCLSLGGGGTGGGLGGLAAHIAPPERAAFVSKLTRYAVMTGLDCIDVDFEGSGVNADYEGFVTALGAALHAEHKEMSAALASWFGKQVTAAALRSFDFVNVMAYDLHNPAGTASPVQGSSLTDSKAEIEYWIARGLSRPKAVLGVPFYGYRWAPGAKNGEAVTYSDILKSYGAAAQSDEIAEGGTTIYLSSRATTQAKAQLARQYGGIMIWELGQDAAGDASLLRAIHDAP